MAHRKLSDAERWQAVGMVRGGMSYIKTVERFNVSHSVIVRLKQRVNQTGSVKECHRTGKPMQTTPKEDRIIKRLAIQWSFSTANTLRSRWIVKRRICRRTLNRRLNNTKFHANASASDNTPQNNQALMGTWPYGMEYQVVAESALVGWKLLLLTPVDGCVCVWGPRTTAFLQEHIMCTTAFGGAGVTVWGCLSLNCKLDLYVLDGTLTG
jgi:transposase